MSKIGVPQINEMVEDVKSKLLAYQRELDQAYLKAEDALSIGLNIKIGPGMQPGSFELETTIKFISDQIKDKSKRIIGGQQLELFIVNSEPAEQKWVDRRGPVGNGPRYRGLGG